MSKKVTVVGNKGMLGSELANSLNEAGYLAIGLNRANFVLNAVAYTKVDEAEANKTEAISVNAEFVDRLAIACSATKSTLIHVSTDYVFDGMGSTPYTVSHEPDPQTAYGYSKLLGEQALLNHSGDVVIFRTAWLYGASGKNFPRTIARKLLAGETVRVVDDQYGSPTWTKDLSKLILDYMAVEERPRIVHATASGTATWFEFAQEIAASLGLDPDTCLEPVSSSEFETLAKRPKYSVLNNSEGPKAPIGDWRERWRAASESVLSGS
jgi:dTDP-4-dehydrorhamnose reductase